jgi:hypothetical protein
MLVSEVAIETSGSRKSEHATAPATIEREQSSDMPQRDKIDSVRRLEDAALRS